MTPSQQDSAQQPRLFVYGDVKVSTGKESPGKRAEARNLLKSRKP